MQISVRKRINLQETRRATGAVVTAAGARWSASVVESLESRQLLASTWFVNAAALTNGNGSSASPFKTIQAAANVVNPGDVVNVLPGTYNEKVVVTRSGSAALPIQFKASGGAVTVTNATVPMWGALIDIRASNLSFDGIDVRDSGWYGYIIQGTSTTARVSNISIANVKTRTTYASGIYTKYAAQVSILNNKIQDACVSPVATHNTQECISVVESDGFVIDGNEIWNSIGNNGPSNGGEAIDAKGNSSNGVIQNNDIHDIKDVGIYLDSGSKQGTGATDDRPMANIVVTRNVIKGSYHGIAVASELGGTAQNITISNNLVTDSAENGIVIAAWNDNGPRSGILIANNTVYRNGFGNTQSTWGGGIDVATINYTNIRILNNVVSQNESWQIANTNTTGAPFGQLTVAGNVSFGGGLSYWHPQIGSPGLNQDPQLVDPAAGDFRLRSTSPAINYGQPAEAPTVDLTGAPRFAAPDAGAYEFVAPAPTGLSLAPTSDTGTPGDNITRLNNTTAASRLSFIVTGVLSGATVKLFSGSMLLGAATATGTSVTILTDGVTALANGVSLIFATQTFASSPSAATSSVAITVDATAPTLAGTPNINIGTTQATSRSQIRTITWTFSEPLAIGLSSFSLKNRDTGNTVSLSSRVVTINSNTATLALDQPGVDASPDLFLPSGNYELSLSPTVADIAGNAIDANADGTPGETATFRFFKLLGDFTGDRRVSNADYLVWKNTYNKTVGGATGVDPAFDLNASGRVSNADYLIWKTRYNQRLITMTDGLFFA